MRPISWGVTGRRPLLQVNPNFKPGHNVEELILAGSLHPQCADIFRVGKSEGSHGVSLKLFKRQEEAIILAVDGEGYSLTTGKGSGESPSHFIPTADACLKAKATVRY
jgi:ATP-dependent helicase YprA (DUF1998 family)